MNPRSIPPIRISRLHYGVAVLPARSRKPRDKAKVENAVLVTERWILARLRRTNVLYLSRAQYCHWRGGRGPQSAARSKNSPARAIAHFLTVDQLALRPLPPTPYEYAEWKKSYCPHRLSCGSRAALLLGSLLVRAPTGGRVTLPPTRVQCFHKGQRISSHRRSFLKGQHTTGIAHMPPAHQAYAEWTPERLVRWAEQSGPATAQLVATTPRHSHPSLARLSLVLGHYALRQNLWCGAARSCLYPCPGLASP